MLPYSSSKINSNLVKRGVKIIDISSSSEGLGIYDRTDLHIGFRVHAHIYCLSHRGISILIEEDGRGAGVNNALSLQGVQAYAVRASNKMKIIGNSEKTIYIVKAVQDALDRMEKTEYTEILNAYCVMNKSYERMIDYINSIKTIL